MKYILITIATLITFHHSFAQQSAKQLQETAMSMMRQGDFANAVTALEKAVQQDPKNLDLLKNLSFANYLKRDFAKAIEVAKPLVQRPDADEETFQILGMSYKSIAAYKECGKLYKDALKKFPSSAVIYNEYGELLEMDDNLGDAIVKWEKGITLDPNYSSNYYNAAKYYTKKGDWIRVILYGELFLNLESFSARVEDVKKGMVFAYRNLFRGGAIQDAIASKATTGFEKAVLETYAKTMGLAKDGINIDNLATIRTRFILEWFQANNKQQYPFHLFDQEQYLLREGIFEAYNQWLFGTVINADAYRIWQNNHPKEYNGFKAFQEGRVFKMPAGQSYMIR
jgi:tetratricopeptide (TPR) repeat protein